MYNATTNQHLAVFLNKIDVLMGKAEEIKGDKELDIEYVREKVCPEIIAATPGLESIIVRRILLRESVSYDLLYQYAGSELPFGTYGGPSLNHQLAEMVDILKSKGTCNYILPFGQPTTIKKRRKPNTFADLHSLVCELESSKQEFIAAVESELYKLKTPVHKAIKKQTELLALLLEDLAQTGLDKWKYSAELHPETEELYTSFVVHTPTEAKDKQAGNLRAVLHKYVWENLLEANHLAYLHFTRVAGAKKAQQYAQYERQAEGVSINSLGIDWKQNPPTVQPSTQELSHKQFALLMYFQDVVVTEHNAATIAAKYGRNTTASSANELASHAKMYRNEEAFKKDRSSREAGRLLKDIETVIPLLQNDAQRERARKQIEVVKDSIR